MAQIDFGNEKKHSKSSHYVHTVEVKLLGLYVHSIRVMLINIIRRES